MFCIFYDLLCRTATLSWNRILCFRKIPTMSHDVPDQGSLVMKFCLEMTSSELYYVRVQLNLIVSTSCWTSLGVHKSQESQEGWKGTSTITSQGEGTALPSEPANVDFSKWYISWHQSCRGIKNVVSWSLGPHGLQVPSSSNPIRLACGWLSVCAATASAATELGHFSHHCLNIGPFKCTTECTRE
jgi:hypothetical protein